MATQLMETSPRDIRLGICVVYLLSEDNEALLDLHLRKITEHTDVPYTIFAAAHRLAPGLRSRLEHHPSVKVCDIPPTDKRFEAEHKYYLEQLIDVALKEGATHLVLMHPDSFPVKTGWARDLASRLSDTCVLATVDDDFTAFLFFRREFYETYLPSLRLSADEMRSAARERYQAKYSHHSLHTGVGFIFKVFTTEGLTWLPLTSSNGRIYSDMVFHFHAASRLNIGKASRRLKNRAVYYLASRAKWLARIVKQLIRTTSGSEKVISFRKQARAEEMAILLADFDGYLQNLRD